MKRTFRLQPLPHPSRRMAIEAIRDAADGMVVTIQEETRTLEQNRLMWPLLSLWERSQTACVNGERIQITKEAWKCILLASYRKRYGMPQQLALGLDGELVPLGYETHVMPKGEFKDFLTFLLAETAERGMELPPRMAEGYEEWMRRNAA